MATKAKAKAKTKTKAKTVKRSARRLPWQWVLILTLFMGELFFYTWCRVQCVQVGIAISTERRKQQELASMQNSLKIELARLRAPERIIRLARENLGLGMPTRKQTIVVP